jgi:hypothetical protein
MPLRRITASGAASSLSVWGIGCLDPQSLSCHCGADSSGSGARQSFAAQCKARSAEERASEESPTPCRDLHLAGGCAAVEHNQRGPPSRKASLAWENWRGNGGPVNAPEGHQFVGPLAAAEYPAESIQRGTSVRLVLVLCRSHRESYVLDEIAISRSSEIQS